MDTHNAVQEVPVVLYGRVLNIGLGDGTLVKRFLSVPTVDEVVSVEIDPGVAQRVGDTERHKVVVGDGITYYKDHGSEFDFVVHDIYEATLGHHNWIKTGGFERGEIAWESV